MESTTRARRLALVLGAATLLGGAVAAVALTRPAESPGVRVDAREDYGSETVTTVPSPRRDTGLPQACAGDGFLPDVVLPAAQEPGDSDRAWSVQGTDVTAVYQSTAPDAAISDASRAAPLARELLIAVGPNDTTTIDVASGSARPDCAWLRFTIDAPPDSSAAARVRDAIQYAGLDLVAAEATVESSLALACEASERGGQLETSSPTPSGLLASVTRSGALDDGGTPIAHAGFVKLVDDAGTPLALGFPAAGGGWAVLIDVAVADNGHLRAVRWSACGY